MRHDVFLLFLLSIFNFAPRHVATDNILEQEEKNVKYLQIKVVKAVKRKKGPGRQRKARETEQERPRRQRRNRYFGGKIECSRKGLLVKKKT